MTELEKTFKDIPADIEIFVEKSFDIADRIYHLITERQLTQRQLAEALGKKESEISKWVRGNHNFTLKTIAKLEAFLQEEIISTKIQAPHFQNKWIEYKWTGRFDSPSDVNDIGFQWIISNRNKQLEHTTKVKPEKLQLVYSTGSLEGATPQHTTESESNMIAA